MLPGITAGQLSNYKALEAANSVGSGYRGMSRRVFGLIFESCAYKDMASKYMPLCYPIHSDPDAPICCIVVIVVIVVQTPSTGSDSERLPLFWMESEFIDGQNFSRWHPFGIAAAEATQLSLPGDGESEPRQKASAILSTWSKKIRLFLKLKSFSSALVVWWLG